jgi:hypothetical protein
MCLRPIWLCKPQADPCCAVTGGKITEAKAFDSKAAIEEYIRELGIPATFYMSGIFMSNLKLATRKVRIWRFLSEIIA